MEKNKAYDYSKQDIIHALKETGISEGDSIFVHSNIGFLGRLQDAVYPEDHYEVFKAAIFEVIGDDGTLTVPTYSYSFCRGEIFDKDRTPGMCGFFSEMVRKDTLALRSDDPNFSTAAIGKKSGYLVKDVGEHPFGADSFLARFVDTGGKICNINLNSASSVIHYAEKLFNVPYRHDKEFRGKIADCGKLKDRTAYYFVRDLDKPENVPEFGKFDKKAKALGLVRTADLGKGQVVSIGARDTVLLVKKGVEEDPFFLIKGKAVLI